MPAPGDNLPILAPSKIVRQYEQDRARQSPKEILRKLKRYLLLLEDGNLHHEACRLAGLKSKQVQQYRYDNPQFAEAEKYAKSEGIEKVEKVLHTAALDGNLLAVTKFLEANDERYAPKRADQNHAVLVVAVTSANTLERIQILKEELERRDRDIPEIFRETNPFLNDVGARLDPDELIVDAEVLDQ